MRWRTGRRSENIEDRRGSGGFPGGGVGRTAVGGGIGTVVLVLAALYFGMDPTVFLGTGGMEPLSYGGTFTLEAGPEGGSIVRLTARLQKR